MNLYFDNAATSWPKAPGVAQALFNNIKSMKGSPGRSHSYDSDRLVFGVRQSLADLLGTDDSSRIVFGLNTTQMINTAIRGILKQEDHVITTSMEHNAVSRTLRYMEKQAGIKLTVVQSSPEGFADIDSILKRITERTKMVVINHASNVTGAVNSLHYIGNILKDSNAFFMVDAAQTIGAVDIDVKQNNIDLLAGPGHKNLLGPTGIGFLYISERCKPDPLVFGGTGSFSDSDFQPEVLPDCYESGTPNIPGLAGLSASLDYIRTTGVTSISKSKTRLSEKMLEGLLCIKGLKMYGPGTSRNRLPVFSFDIEGKDIVDVAEMLNKNHGVITRVGLHCSPWAHQTAGSYPEGTIRISPGLFNTDEDMHVMFKALEHSARNC